MKTHTSLWQSLIWHIKSIKLVDRCLIIFMLILMVQTTFSLFTHNMYSNELNNIDIIIRTTSAGIFGYFLSPNFLKKRNIAVELLSTDSATARELKSAITPESSTNHLQGKKIGFASTDVNEGKLEINTASVTSKPSEATREGQQQIIIATVIGVFALSVLIIIRNSSMTEGMVSTVSQMRDFVSGCVGFLLGSPGIESEQ